MQSRTVQVTTMAEVSSNEAPTGSDSEMNKQLAEAWKNMQDRVRKLAEMSQGQDYLENIQQADVMANLKAIQKGREKSPKTQRINQIFNDTLTVIGKVGGIVADAASQVNCHGETGRMRF
jgi:glucuronate isomerase